MTGDGQEFDPDALLGKTQDLGAFMSRMPELTKTKKLLDMHTNIATALLREINARDVLTVRFFVFWSFFWSDFLIGIHFFFL